MRNRALRLPDLTRFRAGQPNANSKLGSYSTDPTIATAPEPASQVGAAEFRIKIYTYFTQATPAGQETPILYNGDRLWATLTLTLETAGPVAVGEVSQLFPVLSGRGQVLRPGVPTKFNVAKGDRLYIAATAVNRVSVALEAVPWQETITGLLGNGGRRVAQAAAPNAKGPRAHKTSKI